MSTETERPAPNPSTVRAFFTCVVACLVAFAPSLAIGPGWAITFIFIIVLFRITDPILPILGVFGVAKLISLVSGSLTYSLGTWLLDGPTSGLFGWAINTPFLALFGFEHYSTAGGFALGGLLGIALTPIARRFLETCDPERSLIRPVGLVFIVLLGGGFWFAQSGVAQSIITTQTASALGQMNGATADVTGVELDLAGGRLTVTDISLADPQHLTRNLFHGLELSANVSTSDLLRKRVHIEQLTIRRAETGSERAVAGVLIGEPAEPDVGVPGDGEKTIDDYLQDWDKWEERLAQARGWLEKFSGDAGSSGGATGETAPLIATHLIDDVPSLLISEVLVEGMTLDWLGDETFSLSAHNLSTSPSLVDAAMEFSMGTNSDLFQLNLGMPSAGDDGHFKFALRGIPIDAVAQLLKLDAGTTLGGGTLDLVMDGPWRGGRAGYIDLPMIAKLHGINLAIGGSKGFAISELSLPIHLDGPIDRPNVRVDPSAIQNALREAGAQELANFVDAKKTELMDKGRAQLNGKLGELSEKLGDKIGKDINLDVDGLLEGGLSVDTLNKVAEDLKQGAIERATEKGDGLKADALDKLKGMAKEELGGDVDLSKQGLQKTTEELKAEAKAKLKAKAKKLKQDALKKLFGGG